MLILSAMAFQDNNALFYEYVMHCQGLGIVLLLLSLWGKKMSCCHALNQMTLVTHTPLGLASYNVSNQM